MPWVWCPGLTIADQLPPLDPREGGEQLMERVALWDLGGSKENRYPNLTLLGSFLTSAVALH